MLSKKEIENNRIPKQLAKALGIKQEDKDSLKAFKESLYEKTAKENIKLKKQVEQQKSDKQNLIEKLEEDKKKWQEFHNRVPEVPEYIDYIIQFVEGIK